MMNDEIIRFSQRMEQLPPYLFGMINKLKMEKRRQGDDVIDLGMGNPIDPAPEAVTHKLCEVAQDPKTHRYPAADGLAHLRREIALNYQKDYDYGIFSAIQVAGIVAMRNCDAEVDEQVAGYRDRRDILCAALEKMDWPVKKPQAGMFVWARLPQPFEKMVSMQFALQLMQEANVAVAPGIGFGEEGENYLRLALVENEHRIRQALRQMRRALLEISAIAASANLTPPSDLEVIVPD